MNTILKSCKHYVGSWLVSPQDKPVHVLLIGAGGNGGPMVSGIARIHHALGALGHPGIQLSVMDGDAVSPANVGRQLFSVADVGRNKAECLVSRANLFFGLRWVSYPFMLRKLDREQIRKSGIGLVITAVDTVAAREIVHKAIKGTRAYMLDLGNGKSTGQCVLGTGDYVPQPKNLEHCIGRLPTIFDLYPNLRAHENSSQGPSCSVEQALHRQDLMTNTVVSSIALDILWKAFRYGVLSVHGAFVNLEAMRVTPLPVDPATWERMGASNGKRRLRNAA